MSWEFYHARLHVVFDDSALVHATKANASLLQITLLKKLKISKGALNGVFTFECKTPCAVLQTATHFLGNFLKNIFSFCRL
jgi:hypothetical protein